MRAIRWIMHFDGFIIFNEIYVLISLNNSPYQWIPLIE